MDAAVRDSRQRSADFIHSLSGFFSAAAAAAADAILAPPTGPEQRCYTVESDCSRR